MKKYFIALTKKVKLIRTHPLTKDFSLYYILKYINWLVSVRIGIRKKKYLGKLKLLANRKTSSLKHAFFLGLSEFNDMAFTLHVLKRNDTFIDVGANCGIYTLLAASLSEANCVAIEPIPSTFKLLKSNLELNKLKSIVETHNIGLSSEEGELHFTTHLGASNHVLIDKNNVGGKEAIKAKVRTLDDLIKGKNPVLMKIDVEGYELYVLKGAEETLKQESLQAIILELNDHNEKYNACNESIKNFLGDFGFFPYEYAPFDRELTPTREITHSVLRRNTIFIRKDKLEILQERLKKAPLIKVHGKKF